MKRRIAAPRAFDGAGRPHAASLAVVGVAAMMLIPAACGPAPDGAPRQAGTTETAWMAPARLDAVDFEADGLIVTGTARPGDRVVLADPAGVSVAGSTGADGRFSIRLAAPRAPVLYRAEIQSGRDEAHAGSWLVLTPGPGPIAAVLTAGGAVRPLNGSALLSGVDYDGAGLLVSGTAAPGAPVRVTLDDGPAHAAPVNAQGRYVARFPAVPPGPRRVRAVQGEQARSVALTLTAPSGALAVSVTGAGARIDWPTPGGGGQSTWIIDGAPGEG